MHRLTWRRVGLAVADARSGAHLLHIIGTNDRACAHAVLMLKRAFEHVSDDLHVAVTVRGKAVPSLHAVFVDDAKGAKGHEARIVILIEREGVIGIEPAEVEMAA